MPAKLANKNAPLRKMTFNCSRAFMKASSSDAQMTARFPPARGLVAASGRLGLGVGFHGLCLLGLRLRAVAARTKTPARDDHDTEAAVADEIHGLAGRLGH